MPPLGCTDPLPTAAAAAVLGWATGIIRCTEVWHTRLKISCLCCCCCRPRYLDEALARQFTTAVRVGKGSKEAGKTIKEVWVQGVS